MPGPVLLNPLPMVGLFPGFQNIKNRGRKIFEFVNIMHQSFAVWSVFRPVVRLSI